MNLKINPIRGTLESHLFENTSIGLEMMSVLNIEIDLEPIEIEEESIETSIRLEFIPIPFKSLTDIQSKSFKFPINPQDGYIDGSIYIIHEHIPVDITKISFGESVGNKLDAHFIGNIPLQEEFEVPDIAIDCSCLVEFDQVFIPASIVEASPENLKQAHELAKSYYDMNKLSEAKITNNGFMDVITFKANA